MSPGTRCSPGRGRGGRRQEAERRVPRRMVLLVAAGLLPRGGPCPRRSEAWVGRLFRVIADLRRAGTTVLYISHKMNEVFTLSDSVTVLRDGRFVASAPRHETGPEQVVRWMVGREIAGLSFAPNEVAGRLTLRVE